MASRIEQSLFIRALRKQPIERFPVWMMRQAGRYQASYRALRERHSLIELVKAPELAAKVTLNAMDEFGFDAAIIFSDILIVLEAMGLELEFVKGEGPRLSPLKHEQDFARLRIPNTHEAFAYTLDAMRLCATELNSRSLPVIGFAGAPFTLACYAIEGGGSRDFSSAKKLAYSRPDLFDKLCSRIADVSGAFLLAQANAGASALQIFDSWAGVLSPYDFARYALPYVKKLVAIAKQSDVPVIYFSTGTTSYLPLLLETGADALSIDWRMDIGEMFASGIPVQGNLDPVRLLGPWDELSADCTRILETAKKKSQTGYVFNLGHGILQNTPEDNVKRVVELVGSLIWKQSG